MTWTSHGVGGPPPSKDCQHGCMVCTQGGLATRAESAGRGVPHGGKTVPTAVRRVHAHPAALPVSTLGVLWAVLRCYSDGEMRVTRVLWDYNMAHVPWGCTCTQGNTSRRRPAPASEAPSVSAKS